jgi:hypothetical protein
MLNRINSKEWIAYGDRIPESFNRLVKTFSGRSHFASKVSEYWLVQVDPNLFYLIYEINLN